jgi:putative photosynthetic complex assembly protein
MAHPRAIAVLVVIIAVASAALGGVFTTLIASKQDASEARASPRVSRSLIFRDGNAGEIMVFDQGADRPFTVLDRNKSQFIANTVRLLAEERTRKNAGGRNDPFTLTLWSDGRLSLADNKTGETVELAAFGMDNARSFARLLTGPEKL